MKISEHARVIALEKYGERLGEGGVTITKFASLVQAIDEWQASVEQRLAAAAPPPCGSYSPQMISGPQIGASMPCALPAGHWGMHSDCKGEHPLLWKNAPVGDRLSAQAPVPFFDPGPHPRDTPHEWDHASQTASRYEAEPEELPE